jgi:hypothetical protein
MTNFYTANVLVFGGHKRQKITCRNKEKEDEIWDSCEILTFLLAFKEILHITVQGVCLFQGITGVVLRSCVVDLLAQSKVE